MDDRMRGWNWSRPGDDRYCDALPMEHDAADAGEPYVDSLRQLNKIVERILPERSPLSFMSVRPKDVPASLKRSFADHKDCIRELTNRKPASSSSTVTEIPIDSPVKHSPLSTMPGVCIEDSLRLKALRPSDSLNDSAYETYCGDGSNDAIDNIDKTTMADEISAGNDQADYCACPSSKKSESEAGIITGDHVGRFGGECNVEQVRSKSLESEISEITDGGDRDEGDKLSEAFPADSEAKLSAHTVTDRMLSEKFQNGSYRFNAFRSSDSSSTDNLPELRRCIEDDNCGTSKNLSIHTSMSLHATNLGSALSSSSSLAQGSSMIDSDHSSGRRMREGSNTGDEELKSFNCPHCAYSASKKGQVRKHLSVHGIFLCAHCEFACAQASLLEEHRRVRHPGLCGRRLCKKCRVLFQSSELEEHELQCSGEKQKWACHTCGKEFKFLSVMKAHANKWHPAADDGVSTKPADATSDTASSKPCSVSSGTPSVTLNPTPDSVVGREIKQFQCTECGKMFKTKWTLSNHALSHAGGDTPFCCDIDGCSGVTFRSDKELNCHRMAVHRLGPTKYECSHPGCTMQFAKYGHFKRHQLTHAASAESELLSTDASERRFVCDWTQCGKAFSHADNLRVHYRRHTDEKPHHCHHCEAAYRQKSGLKYHLEKVHGEKTVGRCGRKRKLAMEHETVLKYGGSNQLPSDGALASCRPSSRSGELRLQAQNQSGQTVLSDREVVDRSIFSVNHTALLKVTEMNINVADLQPKQWVKSDIDSTVKDRRWSLPESLSEDCDDNLDNIDIIDEWLNEDDGFISKPRKPSEGVTRSAEEGDGDVAGSTSDTEPLDEDFCEELRKLSNAVNTEVLSPRGLDGMSSSFVSPASTAYGASKTDTIGNAVPDVPSSHTGLYQGISGHEEQTGVFDDFSSKRLPHDSNVTSEFYPGHPDEEAVTAVNTSGMLSRGQYSSVTSDQTEIVNGYLPDGYSSHTDVHPAHFDRNTSNSASAHLPVDAAELDDSGSYPSARFDGSVHPWSAAVTSPRWNTQSDENPAFLPPIGISSVSACSSTQSGFGDQICRDDGTYSNLMSNWSPAENSQQWPGHDGIIQPNWSQRHLAIMRGQADVSRRHDWHMGRQGESAFSRSAAAFDDRVSFEPSPKPCLPYPSDLTEVPSMPEHFANSFAGGVYPIGGIGHMGSWSDLYGRSSQMTGLVNYEYNLPRNAYRSAVQSDRCYLASGYSGVQSHASYEHGFEAEGLCGVSNSAYRTAPMHSLSWPMSGLSDARESLRPVPDAQHSSVLYNVVPRYY